MNGSMCLRSKKCITIDHDQMHLVSYHFQHWIHAISSNHDERESAERTNDEKKNDERKNDMKNDVVENVIAEKIHVENTIDWKIDAGRMKSDGDDGVDGFENDSEIVDDARFSPLVYASAAMCSFHYRWN